VNRPADDLDQFAASLTAAMLRFEIERLPRNPIMLPHDQPGRLGEAAFVFLPDQRLVESGDLAGHLASLPKPVMLAALATKGYVATWWRDGLSSRALGVWEHNVTNAQQVADGLLRSLGLTDADWILVETSQDRLHLPVAALRQWITAYRVDIRWRIVALDGDPRAKARLVLGRGDGSSSPGAGCAPRV